MSSSGGRALPERPDLEVYPSLDGDWPAHGLGPVATIAAQLPDPAELKPGALVIVRHAGRPARGFRRFARGVRNLWRKPLAAHEAVRCTALLARGYRDIAAATDPRTGERIVWGIAPTSGRFALTP